MDSRTAPGHMLLRQPALSHVTEQVKVDLGWPGAAATPAAAAIGLDDNLRDVRPFMGTNGAENQHELWSNMLPEFDLGSPAPVLSSLPPSRLLPLGEPESVADDALPAFHYALSVTPAFGEDDDELAYLSDLLGSPVSPRSPRPAEPVATETTALAAVAAAESEPAKLGTATSSPATAAAAASTEATPVGPVKGKRGRPSSAARAQAVSTLQKLTGVVGPPKLAVKRKAVLAKKQVDYDWASDEDINADEYDSDGRAGHAARSTSSSPGGLPLGSEETVLRQQLDRLVHDLEESSTRLFMYPPSERKKIRNRKASCISRIRKKLLEMDLQRKLDKEVALRLAAEDRIRTLEKSLEQARSQLPPAAEPP